MADVIIQERTDEKGLIHRMEIPLKTFLMENNFEAVVRCKDCKYHNGEDSYCPIVVIQDDDDFCSWGERRE